MNFKKSENKRMARIGAMILVLILAFSAVFFIATTSETAQVSAATINVTKTSQKVATYRQILKFTGGEDACKMQPCKHMEQKLFSTMDEAAKDWAKTYAPTALVQGLEYGSTIYKVAQGKYVYVIPAKGGKGAVDPSVGCILPSSVQFEDAVIHNHPMHGISLGIEEHFSGSDMAYGASYKTSTKTYPSTYVYVSTPEGKLKKALPSKTDGYYVGFWFNNFGYMFSSEDVTVSKDMPHDRRANLQVFQFKHWFGKKCANCAQKLAA